MRRQVWIGMAACAAALASCQTPTPTPKGPEASLGRHNVVILVTDGLRYASVNPTDAPELDALRAAGVNFTNSHSVYPTVTTANASAIATGHYLGDTGDFANTVYAGQTTLPSANGALLPFLENDNILRDMNARFSGNYLGETSLLEAAVAHGFSVAALGKIGPTAIQKLDALTAVGAIVLDESTGSAEGIMVSPELAARLEAAKLPPKPPARTYPNQSQLGWFTTAATDVVLPQMKASGKPFVLLVWSNDPDVSQHNQKDAEDQLSPGINGATGRGAIANASSALGRIRAALKAQGLEATTDIFVTADHGFSTVSKEAMGSYAAGLNYKGVPAGELPPGFLTIDLGHALGLPVFTPAGAPVDPAQGQFPTGASAMLGPDGQHPRIVIGANGGSDLIWLPEGDARALVPRIVATLTQQRYVAAIFVDDQYGKIPGALPMSAVRLVGSARTPRPAIVVGFASHSTGCALPELCAVEIADTPLGQGQGQHGGPSRADTRNFMAAIGPDFKSGFVNDAPVSNADIAPTIARILGFTLPARGKLRGRVIAEALWNEPARPYSAETKRSAPAANGFVTVLNLQRAGGAEYYDAAGAEGRTVGLKP